MTPHLMILPKSTIAPPIVARPNISFEEQEMLSRFIRLGPPRFLDASGDDAHEFLVRCQERLLMGESHEVDYIAFQIKWLAKH